MTIKCTFVDGPLDGQTANVSGLHEAQVFLNERDRLVLLYVRTDETYYVFNPDLSAGLSAIYDQAKARYAGHAKAIESWDLTKIAE